MGSLLFLVAMIYLFVQSGGNFSILDWHQLPIGRTLQIWIFLAFLAAFAVKVPMWPVQWLPGARVRRYWRLDVLAQSLCRGRFLRFLAVAPDASQELAGWIIGLDH